MKCLAKQPADRRQTADELLGRLDPMTVGIRSGRSIRRARHVQRAASGDRDALGTVLLVAIGVVLMRAAQPLPGADARAS